jgi:hypothetical protein
MKDQAPVWRNNSKLSDTTKSGPSKAGSMLGAKPGTQSSQSAKQPDSGYGLHSGFLNFEGRSSYLPMGILKDWDKVSKL